MTTIHFWICDYCGQQFDDDDECLDHELLEHYLKPYISDIVFYDKNREAVPFTAETWNPDVQAQKVCFITCKTYQGWATLQLINDYYCLFRVLEEPLFYPAHYRRIDWDDWEEVTNETSL